MKKANIAIIIAVLILISLPILYFIGFSKKPKSENIALQNQIQPSTETRSTTSTESTVPLPSGEDVIRTFFNLINAKRIPDAIEMMDNTMVPDDQAKQAWGVTFNSFSLVGARSISEYNKEEWTTDKQIYKVMIDISIKPGSNVVWEEGDNIRWIVLQKQQGVWKIHEIATGP